MADVDYDALAKQYGGQPVDYDALAKQFGGRAAAAPEGRLARYGRQLAGGAEAVATLASGAIAAPVAGIAGISQAITNAVVPGQISAGDRVEQVQDALTYHPRSATGHNVAKTVATPFEYLAKKADEAGGKVTDVTGSPMLGAEVNTAIQSAPALVLKALSPVARRAAVLARERQEVQRKLNAPRDAAIADAKEAGYVLSPAEANPTLLNRILEGFSGQAKVQQLASAKNQPVTNKIVRKSLGIPDDTPLSVDALEAVRKKAGQAYEDVRGSGRVTADQTYTKSLDEITAKFEGAEKDFPGMAKADIRQAVDAARVAQFDAGSGIDAIKIQRGLADKAFRQGDTELGKAHKAIADAIEGQIDRHLGPVTAGSDMAGVPAMDSTAANFRKARQVIARSYDVQKALKGNDVDARVLAGQLRKGRQLGGGLEKAAEFGARFKGAADTGNKNAYVPVNAFDWMMGGGAGVGALLHAPEAATAGAVTLGVAAARPAIRAGITSGPYQRLGVNPPSYGIGSTRRLAEAMTSDEALAAALGMQGQQGR